MWSTGSSYGILALHYLARADSGNLVPVQELSAALDLSAPYLAKVLRKLTDAGILRSRRGANGGVGLARSASEIKVGEIIRILEGQDVFETCMLGHESCSDRSPCPLHFFWRTFRTQLSSQLDAISLFDLSTGGITHQQIPIDHITTRDSIHAQILHKP